MSVWPSGCVCQAVRAPGSNVTNAPPMRAGAVPANGCSTRTEPVKYSAGPLRKGCKPLRVIFMFPVLLSCAAAGQALPSAAPLAAARTCRRVIMNSLLGKDFSCDRHCRDCIRPTGVECQVGDCLDQLLFGQPILPRQCKVRSKLIRAVHGDQGTDGDQTAIAPGELRARPDIAEQHAVGELRELRGDVAHQLL